MLLGAHMARKKKYDYFKTFEEQAKTVIEEAELLVEVIENFSSADDIKAVLPKAHEIENRGDQPNHENYNAVAVDFVTPIDREDLIDISSSLDSIIDQMEETIMEFYMLHIHSMHESCLEFARYVLEASRALLIAVQDFQNYKKSATFRGAIAKVNDCEEAADEAYLRIMHKMYSADNPDPIYVLVWTRIFDQLEECCDGCEHVADALETVMLKDS